MGKNVDASGESNKKTSDNAATTSPSTTTSETKKAQTSDHDAALKDSTEGNVGNGHDDSSEKLAAATDPPTAQATKKNGKVDKPDNGEGTAAAMRTSDGKPNQSSRVLDFGTTLQFQPFVNDLIAKANGLEKPTGKPAEAKPLETAEKPVVVQPVSEKPALADQALDLKKFDTEIPLRLAEFKMRIQSENQKRSQEQLGSLQVDSLNLADSIGKLKATPEISGDQETRTLREKDLGSRSESLDGQELRQLQNVGRVGDLRTLEAIFKISTGLDEYVKQGEKQLAELIRDNPSLQSNERFKELVLRGYTDMAGVRQLRNLPEWQSSLNAADVLKSDPAKQRPDKEQDPTEAIQEANKIFGAEGIDKALPSFKKAMDAVTAIHDRDESNRIGLFIDGLKQNATLAGLYVRGGDTEPAMAKRVDLAERENAAVLRSQRSGELRSSIGINTSFAKIASGDPVRHSEGKKELLGQLSENPAIGLNPEYKDNLVNAFKAHHEGLVAASGDYQGAKAETGQAQTGLPELGYKGLDLTKSYQQKQVEKEPEGYLEDKATSIGLVLLTVGAGLYAANRMTQNYRHAREVRTKYGIDPVKPESQPDKVVRPYKDVVTKAPRQANFELAGVTRDNTGGHEGRLVVLKNPRYQPEMDKGAARIPVPENFNPKLFKFGPEKDPFKPVQVDGKLMFAKDGVVYSQKGKELEPTNKYTVVSESKFIRDSLPAKLNDMAAAQPGAKGLGYAGDYVQGRISKAPDITMVELAKELGDLSERNSGDKLFSDGLKQAADVINQAAAKGLDVDRPQTKDKTVVDRVDAKPEAVEPAKISIKDGVLQAQGDVKAWLKEDPRRIFEIAKLAASGDVRELSLDLGLAVQESAQHLKGLKAQQVYDGLNEVLTAEKAAVQAGKPTLGMRLLYASGVTSSDGGTTPGAPDQVERGVKQYRPQYASRGLAVTAQEQAWPGLTNGSQNKESDHAWLGKATAKWADGPVVADGAAMAVGDVEGWLKQDPSRVFEVLNKVREADSIGLNLAGALDKAKPALKSIPAEQLFEGLSKALAGPSEKAQKVLNILSATNVIKDVMPGADLSSVEKAQKWVADASRRSNPVQERLAPLPGGITESPLTIDGKKYTPKGTLNDGRVWLTISEPKGDPTVASLPVPKDFNPKKGQYSDLLPVNVGGKELYVAKNNEVYTFIESESMRMLLPVQDVKVRSAGEVSYALNKPANPYEKAYADLAQGGESMADARFETASKYTWSGVPTRDALIDIYNFANAPGSTKPGALVSIGSGNGYWEHLMENMGLDLNGAKYDQAPVETGDNTYHQKSEPWTSIARGGPQDLAKHGDRTLFLSWPPAGGSMAEKTLQAYLKSVGESGGKLVYVGEQPDVSYEHRSCSGLNGDMKFFTLLDQEFKLVGQSKLGSVDYGDDRTVDKVYFYERRPASERPDPKAPPLSERVIENFTNQKAEHLTGPENRILQSMKESVFARDLEGLSNGMQRALEVGDPQRAREIFNQFQRDFEKLGLVAEWKADGAKPSRAATAQLKIRDRFGNWEISTESGGMSELSRAGGRPYYANSDALEVLDSMVAHLSDSSGQFDVEGAKPTTKLGQFIESMPEGWGRSSESVENGKGAAEFRVLQLLREGVLQKDARSLETGLRALGDMNDEQKVEAIVDQFKQDMKSCGLEVTKFDQKTGYQSETALSIEDKSSHARIDVSMKGNEFKAAALNAEPGFAQLSKTARASFGDTGEPRGIEAATGRVAIVKTSDPKVIAEGDRLLERARASLTRGKVDPAVVESLSKNKALLASLPADKVYEGLMQVVREWPGPACELLNESGVLRDMMPDGDFSDVDKAYESLQKYASNNRLLYDAYNERGIRVEDGKITSHGDMGSWLRDDPSRALDVARIAARDNISPQELDTKLVDAIKENRLYLKALEPGTVMQGLKDVLASDHPHQGLALLNETGALKTVYPDGDFRTVKSASAWLDAFKPESRAAVDNLLRPIVQEMLKRHYDGSQKKDVVEAQEHAVRFIEKVVGKSGFSESNRWTLQTLADACKQESGDYYDLAGSEYYKGQILSDLSYELKTRAETIPSKTTLNPQQTDVAGQVREALVARGITGSDVNKAIGEIFAAQTDPNFDGSKGSYELLLGKLKNERQNANVLGELEKKVAAMPDVVAVATEKPASAELAVTPDAKSSVVANPGAADGKELKLEKPAEADAKPTFNEKEHRALDAAREVLSREAPGLNLAMQNDRTLKAMLEEVISHLSPAEGQQLGEMLKSFNGDQIRKYLSGDLTASSVEPPESPAVALQSGEEGLTTRGEELRRQIADVKDFDEVKALELLRSKKVFETLKAEGMEEKKAEEIERKLTSKDPHERADAMLEIDKYFDERIASSTAEATRPGTEREGEKEKVAEKGRLGRGWESFSRKFGENKGKIGTLIVVIGPLLPLVLNKAVVGEDNFGGATFSR